MRFADYKSQLLFNLANKEVIKRADQSEKGSEAVRSS